MPIISRFYGIIIKMYYNDHLPAHFHAIYGEYELIIGISPIKIIEGKAPNRVKSLVLEWSALHQEELIKNWELCRSGKPPETIESLE
jgi:hypothetical protein